MLVVVMNKARFCVPLVVKVKESCAASGFAGGVEGEVEGRGGEESDQGFTIFVTTRAGELGLDLCNEDLDSRGGEPILVEVGVLCVCV